MDNSLLNKNNCVSLHHAFRHDNNMKNVKQFFAILGLLTIAHCAICQENHDATSSVDAEQPVWQWRCDGGDSMINFNPAVIVDSSHSVAFDSIPYAKDYTMVVAYKPVSQLEAKVWELDFGNGFYRGLTTEHIRSNKFTVRYADTTMGMPMISTLRQTAPDSTAPHAMLTLGGDTLAGSIKVAEILYFDHRLDNSMLRRVQSAMAIRYGVTLGPVDYVDGKGENVWNYADSGKYHHRLTGVCRDTIYNVTQLHSRSEMDNPMLTIFADSLGEGEYFVCGDNDAPLSFERDGGVDVLSRKWRVNQSSDDNNYYHLHFDTRALADAGDSVVLLIDGISLLPTSVSPGEAHFNYVIFPSDTSTFTLARGDMFWQTIMSNGGGLHHGGWENAVESTAYPNPTTGSYTIEVTGASWVEIEIYNVQGQLVSSHGDRERMQYTFCGVLPTSGNAYYATVTTESGSQTIKIIVK